MFKIRKGTVKGSSTGKPVKLALRLHVPVHVLQASPMSLEAAEQEVYEDPRMNNRTLVEAEQMRAGALRAVQNSQRFY